MTRPLVGLALGAGAAKGLAHLGVLQVFEEASIPIDVIAGTSIGSMFGALYADQVDLDFLAKFAANLKHDQFIDVVLPKTGLLKGDKVEEFLRIITKNKGFHQLKKPFYAVAVDIETGEEVVINSGSVADAIRASISIPGIFQPKRLEGRLLVDGAVKRHVPVNVVKEHGADYIIAVDVRFGGQRGAKQKVRTIFDILLLSLELAHADYTRNLTGECDILIQPDLTHISPARFDLVDECIELGRKEAEKQLPSIKKDLKKLGII